MTKQIIALAGVITLTIMIIAGAVVSVLIITQDNKAIVALQANQLKDEANLGQVITYLNNSITAAEKAQSASK